MTDGRTELETRHDGSLKPVILWGRLINGRPTCLSGGSLGLTLRHIFGIFNIRKCLLKFFNEIKDNPLFRIIDFIFFVKIISISFSRCFEHF